MVRSRLVVLLALGLLFASPSPAQAEPSLPGGDLDTDGIDVSQVVEVPAPLDPEGEPIWRGTLLDVTMKPTSIWTDVHTRIYLPEGYDPAAPTGYESLYLLHGAGESVDAARAWSHPDHGQIGAIVDASPYAGVVIMPEGGRAGWYTDWVEPDRAGHRFGWQTFHLDQLRPWVDRHLRTRTDRDSRAVAGLSMGGHGALSYAAQRPELFSAAASFSGPGDIEAPLIQQGIIANEVTKFAGTVAQFGSAILASEEGDFTKRANDVQDVIGSYGSDAWARKNPYRQGAIYRDNGVAVSLYAGRGGDLSNLVGSVIEKPVGNANDRLFGRYTSDGLATRYCTGTGAHDWVYWRAHVQNWLQYAYGTSPVALGCPSGWGSPRG